MSRPVRNSAIFPSACTLTLGFFFSLVEPIFEALSLCASLHPDPVISEDDLDDAFVSTEESDLPTFAGDENDELSEVGRVRSDFLNNNRFTPY